MLMSFPTIEREFMDGRRKACMQLRFVAVGKGDVWHHESSEFTVHFFIEEIRSEQRHTEMTSQSWTSK